jgi:hypothetical protein
MVRFLVEDEMSIALKTGEAHIGESKNSGKCDFEHNVQERNSNNPRILHRLIMW